MGRWTGKSCRISSMMGMTAGFFFVEIIIGYVTNSIALTADSFHMLSDVVALIVGFASVRISKWKTKRNTYGWQRAEVLGALVNSVFLVALCFSILVESLKRIVEVEEVENPVMLLIVGGLGLFINILGLFLFGGHGHSHGGGGHGHGHGGHGHGHGGHDHGGDDKDDHIGHGHSHSHNLSHSHSHSHSDHGHSASQRQDNGEGINSTQMQVRISSSATDAPKTGEATEQNVTDSGILNSSTDISTSMEGTEVYTIDNEAKTEVVRHSTASLNMRGVFLHVLGDALGSVVVIISALAIWFIEGHWKYYLDPAMSIVMVMIILGSTVPLFKETAYILLQTVPRHVNVEAITRELQEIDGISGVHECHIWQLAGRRIIASAHVHCKDIKEYMSLANKIKNVFHRAGIHSTTIQPEFIEGADIDHKRMCSLVCVTEDGDKCEQDTCCPPPLAKSNNRGIEFNNHNSNDATQLLNENSANQATTHLWNVDMKMSPEGDEVVLDLSKVQ